MLPKSNYVPSRLGKLAFNGRVAFLGSGDLLGPEATVVRWHHAVLGAAVPETSVHEHREPDTRKDEIRTAREGRP